MRGQNICFYVELITIINNYYQILPFIYLSENRHQNNNLSTLFLKWYRLILQTIKCPNDAHDMEHFGLGLHCLLKSICPNTVNFYGTYLRNKFNFSEVCRSVNYTGSPAK